MICEHCGKEALCYGILSNGREVAWCYDCIKEPDHEESRLASIGESLAVYMTKCEELETECLTLRDAARHQEAECKRLEVEAQDYHDQKEAALSQLVRERQELQAEAARWQAVAVEEHAKVLCAARLSVCCRYDDIDEATMIEEVTDEDRQQAAAALGKPRAWAMSEERIKALELAQYEFAGFPPDSVETAIAKIQAMLTEAKQ